MITNFIKQRIPMLFPIAGATILCVILVPTPGHAQAKGKPRSLDSGFYAGALHLSVSAGLPLQVGGSLIDTEKEYNNALRTRAQTGAAQFSILPIAGTSTVNAGSGPASPVVNFESDMSGAAEFSLDYGLTDHIGVGLLVTGYSVEGRQQESYPFIGSSGQGIAVDLLARETVMLSPQTYELFKGTSVLGSFSWHILSRSKFDPFITARAGVTRFKSNAHSSISYQSLRFQERSISATGTTLGAGIGMNIFFRPTVGMRIEISGLSHKLKTDRFDRTLRSGHLLFGVVLNADAIEKNNGQI